MSLENYITRIYHMGDEIHNDPSLSAGDAILLAHYVCLLKAGIEERIEKGASKKRKILKAKKQVCKCGKPNPVYKGPDSTHVCQSCYRKNKKK
jgi:hypothetical protein